MATDPTALIPIGAVGRAGRLGKIPATRAKAFGPARKAETQARIRSGPLEVPPELNAAIEASDAAFPNTTGVIKPMSSAVEETVVKLTALLDEARPLQRSVIAAARIARTEARSTRVARATEIESTLRSQGVPAREASRRSEAALRGELPAPDFTPLNITPDEIAPMFEHIANIRLQYFDGINARVALERVLVGELPSPGQQEQLAKIFGLAFSRALRGNRSFTAKAGETALDLANLPRQVLTSYDASAPLRQGVVLFPNHPGRWAESVETMFRAMASEGAAQAVDTGIKLDKNFIRFTARHPAGDSKNLFIADLSRGPRGLSGQEELWMSRLAERIPGIRQSQRAYVTFLNKLRMDVMNDIVAGWERAGKKITNNDLDELALFINRATGRGSLGALNKFAPLFNIGFFAPRLLASRLQLPLSASPFNRSQLVRQLAAKELVTFTGTGMMVLSLLALAGATVEIDPRSPDFGKARFGNTSIEFWGGFQPIARYSAQIMTGTKKTISGKRRGEISDVPRFSLRDWQEPVWLRFVRSKLSPIGSLGFDATLGGGENFIGETLLGDDETSRRSALAKQAFNRLVPLFFQDMIDAMYGEDFTALFKQTPDLKEGLKALPAGLGAGVTTFDRE